LCSKGIEIMVNAEKVIFISPRYKEFVLNKYVPQKLRAEIEAKCQVLPNGIDNFWIDNRKSKVREESKKISFIQVGRLMKNKNLDATLKIVKNLRAQGYDASLDIVGDGPTREQVEKWSKEYSEFIKYHGQLNKEEILNLYSKSDIYIMPSKGETFGLVYIEAISQGLPIVYTSGEGVDGYFKQLEVGAAINYNDINESTNLILDIIKDYNNISIRGKEACVDFTWSEIGTEYNNIYREINNKDV
ncbi:MAG: glycosyltransferase family 4 protein, partial [Clostridium sp.]